MKIKIVAGSNREDFETACNKAIEEGYYPIGQVIIVKDATTDRSIESIFYYRQQWAYFEREEEKQIMKDMRMVYV